MLRSSRSNEHNFNKIRIMKEYLDAVYYDRYIEYACDTCGKIVASHTLRYETESPNGLSAKLDQRHEEHKKQMFPRCSLSFLKRIEGEFTGGTFTRFD